MLGAALLAGTALILWDEAGGAGRARGDAELARQVHDLCAACHAYPPPDSFPRSAWADEVANGYGPEVMREIQTEAWETIVLPQLPAMLEEWMEIPADQAEALTAEVAAEVNARKADGGVVTINPFAADRTSAEWPKEKLVKWALGSHEYLLTAIEGWAGDIVIQNGTRHGWRNHSTEPATMAFVLIGTERDG